MKLGKPGKAVEWLRNICEGHKARKEAELAYHVEMVLVEILIYLVSNVYFLSYNLSNLFGSQCIKT